MGRGLSIFRSAPRSGFLLFPNPAFDFLLRGDGVLGPGKRPVSNGPRDIIPSGETISLLPSVLSNAAGEVVRHPDAEPPERLAMMWWIVKTHSLGSAATSKFHGRSLRAQPGDYFLASLGAKSRSLHGRWQPTSGRFLDYARNDGP